MNRSAQLRHAPFALFVGGVLAYGAAFAWHTTDRFDVVNLVRDVNVDDSFFYFQIAWRMAGGEFSTFDGLTRTNGYHPLWLFLITPFYWVFDKTEALFAIKAFEIMLVAGGVALVAGAARVARLPWVLLFAALPALYQNRALFAGLEAAAALFMLGLFLLAVCLFARDPAGWRWPLAAAAFALPWVRLEYAAISVAATAALCLVEWSARLPAAPARQSPPAGTARRPTNPAGVRAVLRRRLPARQSPPAGSARRPTNPAGVRAVLRRRLLARQSPPAGSASAFALNGAAPFVGALAGVLAYAAYNGIVFGGLVPVSAATKRYWSQSLWAEEGGHRLAENVREYLRSGYFDYELLIALEVCVYLALVWRFSRRGRADGLLLAFLVGVSGLAAGHLAKFAQSVLTVDPRWGEYFWYFVPAYLLLAVVVPVRCCVAVWFIRRFIGPGGLAGRQAEPQGDDWRAGAAPWVQRSASIAAVTIGAVCLFARADFAAPFRTVDQSAGATYRNWKVSAHMSALVMDRVLPEDSVVGAGGSGIIAYFSGFPVMNLDGMVNSFEYLRATREGTRDAFLQRHGITHLLDSRRSRHHGAQLFEGPVFDHGPIKERFRLSERRRTSWAEEVYRSAWFRERMEPHLERQTDGVGLLADGRLVQAFTWDCAPDQLAEWTWGPAGREKTEVRPWTQTALGFCASAVVRPPGALPPVRVATMTAGEYLAGKVGDRPPAIDSDFDVYLVENRLLYVKEACGSEDGRTRFFLQVAAADPDDLPAPRRRHGFENLGFRINGLGDGPGARVGGTCLAEITLPEYRIAAIRTGQSGQSAAMEGGFHFHGAWEGEFRLGPAGRAPMGEHLADKVRGRWPAIESDFDVHFVDGALVYEKEACGPEDADARFFLAVTPADPDDLPAPRRQYGFDNLDFRFDGRGARFGGACLVEAPLPEYGIAEIRTGQFTEAEGSFHRLWEGEIRFGPSGRAPMGEYLADRVRGRRPAIDADFAVHLVDDTLVYVKEACGPEDVVAQFFLHVEAVDPDDLPVPRRPHGFDNLDFRFDGPGVRFDGACLAEVPLPEYGVAAVRTGQFAEVEGGFRRFWEGEIRLGANP